ncbi:MAG: WD40 repeat domain-containing protein [Hyphomonadaceae bacterium JAD_PAG50586_4]|nr:MAG: WD40 repeat domain-containing protein [Hyphomonadaceae bacterium JAD_PAG50586_4]
MQTEAQAQIERILATSSDGRFFATGGADGMVRVFDAANPRRQLVTFAAQGDNVCQSQSSAECDPPVFMPQTTQGPVISIAIQNLADGRLIVAAATRNGTVKLFDGRSGSLVQDSDLRSSGLRPLIALGADGSWAVAHQDQRGASVLTTNAVATAIPEGGPVLALAAGRDARSWVLALSDGRLVLKVAGSLGFATPDVRLPGRARSIAVVGSTVRATGDDGSVLEADIAGADLANAGFLPADPLLTNARLLPADSRLALGPAVGWRGTSAATPPHGFP